MTHTIREVKPRYTICTIITGDKNLVERVQTLRKNTGATHVDIYEAGLKAYEAIINENKK